MSADENGALILPAREDEKSAIRLSVHIHFAGNGGGVVQAARPGKAAGWFLPVIVVLGVAGAVWYGGRAIASRVVEAKLGSLDSAAAPGVRDGGDKPGRGEMPAELAKALNEPPVVSPGPDVKSGTPSGPEAFGLHE